MAIRYASVGALSLGGSTYLIRQVGAEAWAAYSIAYFLTTFAEQTLGATLLGALVRATELHERLVQAAAGLAQTAAIGLSLLVLAASAPAGSWYGDDRLTDALLGVAAAYYLAGVRSPALALLERDLRYGWVAAGEILDNVTFTAVAVIGVATGNGFASLVVALAVRNLPATILLCFAARTPLLGRLHRRETSQLLAFTRPALGYAVFALVNGLGAALILGGGHATELAFFLTTSSIIGYAAVTLVVVQRVGFPTFAALQGDRQQLTPAIDRTLSLTNFLMVATILPAAASSPVWLPWLFGQEWEPAGATMIWLGVGLLGFGVVAVLTAAANAIGQVRDSFVAQATSTVLYLLLGLLLSRTVSWALGAPIALAVSRFGAAAYLLWRLRASGIAITWRGELVLLVIAAGAMLGIGRLAEDSATVLLLIPAAVALWAAIRRSDRVAMMSLIRSPRTATT